MIQHIIFDCFGTLIDTGNGSIKAVQQILASIGASVEPAVFYKNWKQIKKQMTHSSPFINEKMLFQLSLGKVFSLYGISADPAEAVKPMIQSLFASRTSFPDVPETLQQLTDLGLDLAIGSTTDTDSLLYYLRQNHLSFEHIYTSENMQVYKPADQFYLTILRKTGWSVDDCLFVGDSYIDDVCGPKHIGMKAALLDRSAAHSLQSLCPQPDWLIHTLSELPAILRKHPT